MVWSDNLNEGDHLKHRRRWEDNIKADLKIIWERVDVVQDRDNWRAVVNAVMKLRFRKKYIC